MINRIIRTKIQQPFRMTRDRRDFTYSNIGQLLGFQLLAFLFFQGVVVNNTIDNKNDDSDDADNITAATVCVACIRVGKEEENVWREEEWVLDFFLCAPILSSLIIPIIVYDFKIIFTPSFKFNFRKLSFFFLIPLFRSIEIVRVCLSSEKLIFKWNNSVRCSDLSKFSLRT